MVLESSFALLLIHGGWECGVGVEGLDRKVLGFLWGEHGLCRA